MKKALIPIYVTALLLFTSCEEFFDNAGLDEGLTEERIIEGLKTALAIGTDSASTSLSTLNGYFRGSEALAVIPLPDDVQNIRNTINDNSTLKSISNTVGLEQAFKDVVKGMNRAAEDAAKDAAPIFKDAITGLSISQGLAILEGEVPDQTKSVGSYDSTAATQYLRNETYGALTNAYAPKINNSLDKDLIGNISPNDAWSSLTSTYNSFLGRNDVSLAITAANLAGADIDLPSTLDADIGTFATGLALDELFFHVGEEEKKIRKDPFQWAEEVIQEVFGWVQEQME